MPLERYRQKRDFSKTPEPAGERSARPAGSGLAVGSAGGRFVVGRHRATRLHYDLRLEIDGVLASWAVPRGPSLDPSDRRMAIHVEDHPIEYLTFEAVIPKGQYGAGDAIVWDWGTYEPEAPTLDPLQAIRDGELKFRLDGQKLAGRFTLVRTSERGSGARRGSGDDDGGKEQWLLIHKRDQFAVEGWDAEAHPGSVMTGRTNEEVARGEPPHFMKSPPEPVPLFDLEAAVEAPFPGFIEPMLATLASEAFDDPDWLYEIKWDGYRVEAVVRDGMVRPHTRNGKDAATYFPNLLAPPDWIAAREAVVDGEVVALDEDGRPDFGLLQERLGVSFEDGSPRRRSAGDGSLPAAPLVYQAFDLMYLDGWSLLRVPLEDRKRLLRQVLREHPRVRFATHVEAAGKAFLDAAKERGLEGILAKNRRSPYEPGRRASTWLKIKIRPEQELVVGGYLPGQGNAKDLGAVLVGTYEDGKLRYAGRVGSGFNSRTRRELRSTFEQRTQEACPFEPAPERKGDLRGAIWVKPELVIRAEFSNWTRDGLVRQAAYKGIEPGRDPKSVTRERPVPTETAERAAEKAVAEADPDPPMKKPRRRSTAKATTSEASTFAQSATEQELDALDRMGREGVWQVGGFELKLTNLDKILFPPAPDRSVDPPITKRELIRYFARISPTILPHLAERALNVQRFPDGADAPGFWQKAIPTTAPKWLRLWTETGVEDRKPNTHLIADRVATMAWLGNQAAFEIHPWTSKIDAPWLPTFALIDIDPGDRTTREETLLLARLFRTALEHLGVLGCPKTTGKRGLQIWIPIEPKYSYRETSAWVEGVSRAVGSSVPDLISWEWSKSQRKGRARLDYTQNSSIRTLVAPYAVRPAAGAPVSAPIAWDELDDPALRSDRWTIHDIVERVDERGDLFASALTQAQELPKLD